jgi:Flp pilus assembly protein TadB
MSFNGDFPPPGPDAPSSEPMRQVDRQQYALEQQMMEAKLEIIRSHRQQKEARVSRVVFFIFVFAAAGLVAYVMDAKGYSPQASIGSCVATIVIIGTWWAYRKPY